MTWAVPGCTYGLVFHSGRWLAAVPYEHDVEVLLETTAEEARRISPSTGTIAEAEGGVLLRARAERLDGMARMLAGLGWPFVIHRPDGLRTAVRELSADLAVQAARPTRHGVAPSR